MKIDHHHHFHTNPSFNFLNEDYLVVIINVLNLERNGFDCERMRWNCMKFQEEEVLVRGGMVTHKLEDGWHSIELPRPTSSFAYKIPTIR